MNMHHLALCSDLTFVELSVRVLASQAMLYLSLGRKPARASQVTCAYLCPSVGIERPRPGR